MRTLTKLAAVLFLAVGSGAMADPAPAPTRGTIGPSAKQPPTLTIAEMTVQSVQLREKVEADSKRIEALREQARKQKDVIKLNCVNDKIVELKAQQNIFDEASDHLSEALAKDSPDRVDGFSRLASTADAVHALREGAGACIGAPELYKQESGGDSTRPIIPDDPGKDHPFDSQIEAPGYCSPFN